MIDYHADRNLLLLLLSHKYRPSTFLVPKRLTGLPDGHMLDWLLVIGTPKGQVAFGLDESDLFQFQFLLPKLGQPEIEYDLEPEVLELTAERITALARVYD